MDKEKNFIKSQISSNLQDIATLIDTGVFGVQILRLFQEPVFVSLILKLHDLLQKLKQLKCRVNFTDDIPNGDITDLVSKIRNAICHLDSGENILDKESQLKFVFGMIIGKVTAIAKDEEDLAKSDYNDDIAFFYGTHRIYLKRHIIRVLNEAQKKVQELFPD